MPQSNTIKSEIFSKEVKLGLTIFISGLGLIFFYLAKDIIAVFIMSVFCSIAIRPFLKWGKKWKSPEVVTLIILYLILGFIFTVLFIDLVPFVFNKLYSLIHELPSAMQATVEKVSSFTTERNIKLFPKEQINSFILDSSKYLASHILSVTTNTVYLLTTLLFVLFISGYLALDSENMKKNFLGHFPKEHQEMIYKKINLFNDAVKRAFYGKIVTTVILSVTILIGLWILKIDKFLAISILAFLLDFIPFIGSTIATIVGVVFGLNHSLFSGVAVLVIFLIANFIQTNITTPLFIGKEASLHPILVLFGIAIGSCVWGLLGAIISIPLLAAIVAILKDE